MNNSRFYITGAPFKTINWIWSDFEFFSFDDGRFSSVITRRETPIIALYRTVSNGSGGCVEPRSTGIYQHHLFGLLIADWFSHFLLAVAKQLPIFTWACATNLNNPSRSVYSHTTLLTISPMNSLEVILSVSAEFLFFKVQPDVKAPFNRTVLIEYFHGNSKRSGDKLWPTGQWLKSTG